MKWLNEGDSSPPAESNASRGLASRYRCMRDTGQVMVGRSTELARMASLVDRTIEVGEGGTLLVLGEAGIGKSAFLAETAHHARGRGMTVLAGRAVEGGGTYRAPAEALVSHFGDRRPAVTDELRPYMAALNRLLPGWGDSPATPAWEVDPTLVLGEGLLRLLSAVGGSRGTLLMLEDVHWADADTLALIDYLSGAVAGWPVLMAVTARNEEPFTITTRSSSNSPVTTLQLERLHHDEVLQLATARAGDTPLAEPDLQFVVQKSDGLPFMVEELVSGMLEASSVVPIPPTLAGLVESRLSKLTPEQRHVLAAAATLGGDPDWLLLETVTGLPEGAVLDALHAAHPYLLTAAGDHSRWRHALTRDAVAARVTPPERALFARRACDVLLARRTPEDDARAGELLAAAGDRAGSGQIFLKLARQELARGGLRSAAQLLDRVEATRTHRSALAIERVRLLTLTGHAAAALEIGARQVDEMTGPEHAEYCLRLAGAAVLAGRWAEVDGYVERAGRPEDPVALVLAADSAFGMGDPERAADLAAQAVTEARAAQRWDALCQALTAYGRCAMRRDPDAATAAFRQAAQLAAEHRLLPERIAALLALCTVEMYDHATSPALLEARELALDTGQLAQVVGADILLAETAFTVSGPQAAEALARDARDQAMRLRLTALQAMAELLMAFSRAGEGDEKGMEAMLATAAGHPDKQFEVTALAPAARALRLVLARDLDGAKALLDTCAEALLQHAAAAPVPTWGLWVLLRTVANDRGSEARAVLRGSPAGMRAINRGGLAYAEAVVAGRAGDATAAGGFLVAGDRALDEHLWWRRLLRLIVLEAAVTDGWGDPVSELRAELAALEQAREAELARACRDLLRRAGAPTRRGRGLGSVPADLRALGVTSREMDVLRLIAEGLGNQEIAQRLFLSPRTVETHVARLLTKTGAGGRRELRAMVKR
ncbi:ATP-binding protein [Micromonospora chersina]|uniref:ATP-binding protein n=1 Tax=Micromonospora chersina TaxID=47854 RepID=UPI00371D4082